jgi:hypothetical protein
MLPKLGGLNNKFLKFEKEIIQKISWQFFSDGVDARKSKTDIAALYTKYLVFNSNIKTIYEASFIADSYLAKVDVLRKLDETALCLFMVKSASKYKNKYVSDMSFDAMVLTKSGINVQKYVLLCLSDNYRLGMDASAFFKVLDCTEKVRLKVGEFSNLADEIFKVIESEKMPEPYLKKNCRNCLVFDSCMGKGVKNHIFDLPSLSITSTEELIALGADTIHKIPPDFELTEAQKIVKNCVLKDITYISENLKAELNSMKQPFYYLDFESVTTAVPLYKYTAPYTQLLTQFSIDKTDFAGNILDHYEYIADQTKDCRREITEKFIEYLGLEGSIITYANFERTAIFKLMDIFPDLSEKLSRIIERVVNLELVIRKNYYNINFHGRSSIKRILPVLVPEMNYSYLEIKDGKDAAAAFALMAVGLYDSKKIEKTKYNLLKYCAMDTLAMVRIHQFLISVVK